MPVPANVATLDQPKATTNAAPAPPKQEGPDPGSQPSDPAIQESPSPQPRPSAVKPNSDPKDVDGPQQGSDPKQGNDPNKASDLKQVGGNGGQSGQEADPKPNIDPNQVDPDPQNDPNQTADDPFNDFSEGQAKTINNQVVQPLSYGISIAGTTLTPEAPPITVSGTLIHLGSSALIIGTSTVPLAPELPIQIITTIAGQIITAAPNAVAIAGSTLSSGAPGITIDGTIVSLDTAGQFIVGSKTIPLISKAPETIKTNVAGHAITAAPNAVTIAGTILTPGAPGVRFDGTLLSLDTASQLIVGPKTIPLQSASSNSITTTIDGQVVTAGPDKMSIGGTALTPGASGVTVGGTLVSLNTASQLIIGSKTVTLPSAGAPSSGVDDPITTTIDGQVITAGPTALAIAGTTLTPGAPGFTINGTLVSLNTASQLVVGSETIPLGSGRTGSNGQTAGLGGLIMGGFGSGGPFRPFASNSPLSTSQGNLSATAGNGTGNGVQVFAGDAANIKGGFLRYHIGLSMTGMVVLAYMC